MTPEEIEPRVADALRLMQAEFDDSYLCPRAKVDLDRALLMLMSKGLRMGLAVCQLAKTGFYGEAYAMMRSVLEMFLLVKYIASKNSEERPNSYLEFVRCHYYNQEENIRSKLFPHIAPPDEVTPEFLSETKQRFPKTTMWKSVYELAMDEYDHPDEIDPATGKGYRADREYAGTYETSSHYAHVMSLSLAASHLAEVGKPFVTAKRDKEPKRGVLALYHSLGHVYQASIIVARQWGCTAPQNVREAVDSVMHDIQIATTVTGEAEWFKPAPAP